MTYQNETLGLLTSEAERLGKITVGTELGWGEAVNRDGVRYARHGVRAAAIQHGLMSGAIEKIAHHADGTQRMASIIAAACYVPAPFAGHYEEVIPCGALVKQGDIVGYLHDFQRIDDPPWPARAAVDGLIVGQAWGARVLQGQHIVCVGEVM